MFEIIELLVNAFTAYGKHYLHKTSIFRKQFKCNFVLKKKFTELFAAFLKCISNFHYFGKKRMALIGDVFLKLAAGKDVLT